MEASSLGTEEGVMQGAWTGFDSKVLLMQTGMRMLSIQWHKRTTVQAFCCSQDRYEFSFFLCVSRQSGVEFLQNSELCMSAGRERKGRTTAPPHQDT